MAFKQNISVRSDFSLGESTLKIKDVIARSKELGLETVALVDTMTVSSMVEFSALAKKAGIRPIIGCTLRVYDDPRYRKPPKASGEVEKINRSYQLKVYVHNDAGLRSLLRLLSKGNSEEYFYYHSRVGLDDVMELENVTVTTGDLFNVFHHPDHVQIINRLMSKFQTFVEIVPIHTPLFDTLNKKALDAQDETGCPMIAGYPALYGAVEHADSRDVLSAITGNIKMSEARLPIPYVRDYCMESYRSVLSRTKDTMLRIGVCKTAIGGLLEEFYKSSDLLVAKCNYEFKKLPPCLPKMAPDEFRELVRQVGIGWKERLYRPVMGHQPTPEDLERVYKPRLAYELGVLKRMGFSGYFLLVQDVVSWAKGNGIFAGPGRGSSAGSLVAYLLGITDADPIRFGLIFERFINPSRIDLPDADLDFMSSRRHEIIAYLIDKYGEDRVAGVSNYTTMGPAAAIRNASRIHELNPFEYACSKQVEKEHGVSLSLEKSAESVPDIAKFKDQYPKIWSHALNLEGVMSGLGQHAAGIVIADEPLINRAVVETRTGGPVVNWDKRSVEDWGLIKMDILGLSTLDILRLALDYIYERHGKRLDLMGIPLDDDGVMKAFADGNTVGIFQLESSGMKRVLMDLSQSAALTFDDIAATTAMYRPGPIEAGFVDEYIAVKQGRKTPSYDHPLMEPALKSTCGVMVFQEQVMKICCDLAGFSLTDADHVRKALGKKDADKMAEWKVPFVEGAVKSGMTDISASILWEKIAGFASYGFNKSHAVVYSILSYWSMYIKVFYPAEFFAATMSVVDKEEKLTPLVLDARKNGLRILPPDINRSSDRIEIYGEKDLYMPFQAIKGISTTVARYIVETKKSYGAPFTKVEEFEAALATAKLSGKVNKSHREKMSRVGSFAEIQEGSLPAISPDRLKDQLELMPGFTVDSVRADRDIPIDVETIREILALATELQSCDKCSLSCSDHPAPRMGKTPKFMVVFDAPNWDEVKAGKMLEGNAAGFLKAALNDAGLSPNDAYYTSIVKAPKPAGMKVMPNESITACSQYLQREIDLLKPPVIVAMGSNAIRYFAPTVKGGFADMVGKVIYDPKLDASIVFGINPAQIVFDTSKVKLLQDVCSRINELVN